MNGEDRTSFSKTVDEVLRKAGWFPGRSVDTTVDGWIEKLDGPGGFQIFPAARHALRTFGDLEVRQDGPGIDHARQSFEIDPTSALGDGDLFDMWAQRLGARLYPLGEAGPVADYLAIDENGRVFLLTDALLLVGMNIKEALERLILGKKYETLSL
jgi:hypothetical protein